MKKLLPVLFVTFFFIGFGQPGSLDPSFGNQGIVRTDFGSRAILYDNQGFEVLPLPDGSFYLVFETNRQAFITHRLSNGALDLQFGDNGYSVPVFMRHPEAVRQQDGKIIVGGTASTANRKDFALARFNTDGSLDNSFSGDGYLTIDFSSTDDSFTGLALQGDGKIVMAGSNYDNVNDRIALARINPNGTPDPAFSGDGKLVTNLIGGAGAHAVAIQPDGRIVITGNYRKSSVTQLVVARYLPDGSIDNSFGENGFRYITQGSNSSATTIAIQPDGKIITAGATLTNLGVLQFLLVRLNSDGSLDPAFSDDGIQVDQLTDNDDVINDMALQSDGKLVVAGTARTGNDDDFIVARYNADGSLDNSFSGDGFSITGVNAGESTASASAASVALQSTGKILVAGTYLYSMAFAVASYQADGNLEQGFGQSGIMKDYKHAGRTTFYATTVQPDGKIVAAGSTQIVSDKILMAVARFNTYGSLDNSFSGDGLMTEDFSFSRCEASSIAIQPDGKIVVGGHTYNGVNTDFALIRLHPNGTADNSFSGDGEAWTDIAFSDNGINAIVIQPDGKIVAGGFTAMPGSGDDFALVRYNSNGSIDPSFSGDGIVTTDFGDLYASVVAVLLQPDGKLIAVGNAQPHVSDQPGEMVLVRYNADGSTDMSFGVKGMVTVATSEFVDKATTALLQPDGKMVVAGSKDKKFWVLRFNSDGSPDNSFSGYGNLLIDFNRDYAQPNSIALQPGGQIIIGGLVIQNALYDMALARVNADGSLDNSFGDGGKRVIDLGYGEDVIYGLALHGDRLYAAGKTVYGGQQGMVAAFRLGCDLSVTIPNATTLKRGVDSNAVYPAYQPAATITLMAQATGGVAPYTYLWSNGATTSSVTVSPSMATSFTVTVTDAAGCSQTASRMINVVDVRCGNKMDKVMVCQVPRGNPAKAHSICVSANAVATHLNTGSRLGSCSIDASMTKRIDLEEQAAENVAGLTVFPNPTHTSFTLNYRSGDRSQADMIVWDAAGRVVEKRNINPGQTVEFGSAYRPGIYYVQLTQGDRKQQVKIVKEAR